MNDEIRSFVCEEMKNAENSLKSAKKLLEEKLTKDAISRAYYAIFHSARAALMTKGIETKTHQGLLKQFALHLVKPGLVEPEYGDLLRQEKEDRETGDYEPFASFDLDETGDLVQDAERFVVRIRKFLDDSGFKIKSEE